MDPVNIPVISVVFICLMLGQGSQAGWPSVIINRNNAEKHTQFLCARLVCICVHVFECVHFGLDFNLHYVTED